MAQRTNLEAQILALVMIRYPIFLLLFSNFLVAFQLFTAKFQIKFKLYNLLSYFTRTRTRVLLIPENPFDFRVQTNTTKRSRDAKNMIFSSTIVSFMDGQADICLPCEV